MSNPAVGIAFVCIGILLLPVGCVAPIHLEYGPGQVLGASGGGMVVAADPTAAEVGAGVLREGGNAVDAAVATAFALGATLPQAGNPGGGGFAVLILPGGEPEALDFRETAPTAAHRHMYLGADGKPVRSRSLWTPLAAGVPGTPAGLWTLHRRHGRLPWARVVQPAVDLARDGFPIPSGLALALNDHRRRFAKDAAARRIFVRPDRHWREGDILVQEDLSRILLEIRDRGAAGFYEGSFARAVGERLEGGVLTAADLAAYRPVRRVPAAFDYRGRRVVTMPLPSSGGVVLSQILGILDAVASNTSPGTAERLHLFAEAERRAFADRNALLGDPAGVPGEDVRALTSREYIGRRAATIDPDRATPSSTLSPGVLVSEGDSTTNLVVVDRHGGAVALTFTLNATFGSHIVVPGTGVILNNEMDDFAVKVGAANQFGLRQGERNAIVPGRRPLSSMAPTLVLEDGRVVLAVGSPGGPRILTAVALTVSAHVGDGIPLDIAVLAPRMHHQHLPDRISWEDAAVVWPPGRDRSDLLLTRRKRRVLQAMGHDLEERDTAIGRVTAISVDPRTGRVTGVADPRGYGRPAAEFLERSPRRSVVGGVADE